MIIAALYVEVNGVYAGLPGVDVWDEARQAQLVQILHLMRFAPPAEPSASIAPR